MGVNARLHAPTALPLGNTPLLIQQERVWIPQLVWSLWREGKLLLLRSIEPRIIGRPAQIHCSIQSGSVPHGHYSIQSGSDPHVSATKQCSSFFIKVKCVTCR
jgi:hypothetical protein